jgi:hypothetical protein
VVGVVGEGGCWKWKACSCCREQRNSKDGVILSAQQQQLPFYLSYFRTASALAHDRDSNLFPSQPTRASMQARSTLARSGPGDRRAGAPSLGACDRAELDEACFCPDFDGCWLRLARVFGFCFGDSICTATEGEFGGVISTYSSLSSTVSYGILCCSRKVGWRSYL